MHAHTQTVYSVLAKQSKAQKRNKLETSVGLSEKMKLHIYFKLNLLKCRILSRYKVRCDWLIPQYIVVDLPC